MNKKQIILEKYKETTLGKAEFVRQMMKELDTTERYVYKALASEEVKGETEYTPKHELTDKGYKVNYANTYVEATHEEIRKSFMMYCVGGLTMNQVSLKMGWTRAEFNAIKTAFHITKDAPPFTPYEIDQLTADEMAELIRIEKKRYSLAKFEQNKHKDIEKEIKRYNQADFWIKRFAELINEREERTYQTRTFIKNNNYEHVIKITDEHSGLKTDNVFNKYNYDIMDKRFNQIAEYIYNNIEPCDLKILSCGDMVHGTIHGSTDKHSDYMIDSAFRITDQYITLFDTLLERGYTITFAKSNGSHSSLEKAKKDRTEEDNLGRYLPYTLERTYRNQSEVNILETYLNTNMCVVPLFDYAISTMHGDESNIKGLAATANTVSRKINKRIISVECGHIHHKKCEEINGVLVNYSNSFCGSDQYGVNFGDSPAGFTYKVYDKNGEVMESFIEFKED